MTKRTSNKSEAMTGEELGLMLLQTVLEMKAGKAARATQVAPNEIAAARMKTGLSQAQFSRRGSVLSVPERRAAESDSITPR